MLISDPTSSSSLWFPCSKDGRFSLWNISSRDSCEETRSNELLSWASRKGINLLAPIFALKLWKPVFMDCHFAAIPEDGSPGEIPDWDLPPSSKDTLAEVIFFSAGFAFDCCLLCSLIAAYLWLMASLLVPYLWPSSLVDLDELSLVISWIELADFISTAVASWNVSPFKKTAVKVVVNWWKPLIIFQ